MAIPRLDRGIDTAIYHRTPVEQMARP
jgi:hypothetical protein